MKRENDYWEDENQNKWTCNLYTKEQAQIYSNTLYKCRECIDCKDCENCEYGINLRNCENCEYCEDCEYCEYCKYCKYGKNLRNCKNCEYCENCENCKNCEDFKYQPEIYSTKKIGSRYSITFFYFYEKKIYVYCGCFRGNLAKFKKKVCETYKHENEYYKQYISEIEKVKRLWKRSVPIV